MTGAYAALVVGCAAMSFAVKAVGPVAFGGRELPQRMRAVVFLLAAPLLAALVVTQALANDRTLAIDAETAGVAAAGLSYLARTPLILCLVVAAGVTAGARALGA